MIYPVLDKSLEDCHHLMPSCIFSIGSIRNIEEQFSTGGEVYLLLRKVLRNSFTKILVILILDTLELKQPTRDMLSFTIYYVRTRYWFRQLLLSSWLYPLTDRLIMIFAWIIIIKKSIYSQLLRIGIRIGCEIIWLEFHWAARLKGRKNNKGGWLGIFCYNIFEMFRGSRKEMAD